MMRYALYMLAIFVMVILPVLYFIERAMNTVVHVIP
jgi:hypothetical protein